MWKWLTKHGLGKIGKKVWNHIERYEGKEIVGSYKYDKHILKYSIKCKYWINEFACFKLKHAKSGLILYNANIMAK